MRFFAFIIVLYQKNIFLVHNGLKLKWQGGDTEPPIKTEFTRILFKELGENENMRK